VGRDYLTSLELTGTVSATEVEEEEEEEEEEKEEN
jgi:hypothetical protein